MFFKRIKDKNKSIEQLAEDGDVEACYKLGLKFYNGTDGEYDFQRLKAADEGVEDAENALKEYFGEEK